MNKKSPHLRDNGFVYYSLQWGWGLGQQYVCKGLRIERTN